MKKKFHDLSNTPTSIIKLEYTNNSDFVQFGRSYERKVRQNYNTRSLLHTNPLIITKSDYKMQTRIKFSSVLTQSGFDSCNTDYINVFLVPII